MVILVHAPSLMSLYPSPVTPLSSLYLSVYSSNTSSKIEWVLLNFIFYGTALLQVCDQPTCRAWHFAPTSNIMSKKGRSIRGNTNITTNIAQSSQEVQRRKIELTHSLKEQYQDLAGKSHQIKYQHYQQYCSSVCGFQKGFRGVRGWFMASFGIGSSREEACQRYEFQT